MLVGVLVTFLVVILVLYLINMLPMDGRAKQIARVIVIIIGYGTVPWIALTLAATFATYGLVKKQIGPSVDAISGLTLESLWLIPVAAVQLIVKLGQEYLPQSGVYTIAALAGLTDVDAITLSMAQDARGGGGAMHTAVVAIAVATVSNTLVKAGMAAFLGKDLRRPVLLATGAILAVGAVALLFT